MRITQEADNAVRIIYYLSRAGDRRDAKTIAESVGISQRFALKILGKLSQCGFINSFKGASGGYVLALDPEEITLYQVVSAIDGPIAINKCLTSDNHCTHAQLLDEHGECPFKQVFSEVSRDIELALDQVTFARFLDNR